MFVKEAMISRKRCKIEMLLSGMLGLGLGLGSPGLGLGLGLDTKALALPFSRPRPGSHSATMCLLACH